MLASQPFPPDARLLDNHSRAAPSRQELSVVRRLAQAVLSLSLLVPLALAGGLSAEAASGGWNLAAAGRFSPNGDGVKDTLRIRYRLPERADVRFTISPASDSRRPVRRVQLGEQEAGTHTWTWNGRNQSGKQVLDKAYVIRMYDSDPDTSQRARAFAKVQVDTVFWTQLTAPTYGAEPGAPARVFPRTTVVTDTLDLRATSEEKKLVSLELTIRNSRGRVVRRADVAEPLSSTNGGVYGHGRTVSWAAVRGGRPLPRGRYTAVVAGRDKAGNTGRSQTVKIWVSDDELEWRETTTTVTPEASEVGPCDYSTANGCGDYTYCGRVVASSLFPGGLSYRSAECTAPTSTLQTQPVAGAMHMLEVPEATGIRGLSAVRVSFDGAPTTAGEADTGTLYVHSRTAGPSSVAGTSGQSAWVQEPSWGAGLVGDDVIPQRDPAAVWSFFTKGTDSVDVASYTVDVRYLAAAD
jgi:hypothetical protein